ncbi:PIN domain-like protein [Schizophyllum fasciatum]
MGIPGLWKIIEPIRTSRTHAELCVHEGYLAQPHRALVIGVDAEGLVSAVKAKLQVARHVQTGRNAALKTLFYILCHFGRIPATLVFVFDGPNKPKFKRGKKVVHHELLLIDFFKQFIDAFGFYHRTAAGDAEKELCDLQRLGCIDIIWSEDSDVWVFGATHVVRRADENTFHVYSAQEIERALKLNAHAMLLFALVGGGDYHDGLAGAGPELAYALAQTSLSLELAKLIQAGRASYDDQIRDWRKRLAQKLESGVLGRRYSNVAHAIPHDFPSWRLVSLYTNAPSTVQSSGTYAFGQRLPNVPGILAQCVLRFEWRSYDRLYNLTVSKVWTVACVRQLMQVSQ